MSTLYLDDARTVVRERRRVERANLQKRPEVRIMDKSWQLVAYVQGELMCDAEEIGNESGEAQLALPAHHKLVPWLMAHENRPADVHIVIETPYLRWAGKARTIDRVVAAGQMVAVNIVFIHDYDRAKSLICYATPGLPAEFQPIKADPWVGPAITGVNSYGLKNMWRLQMGIDSFPDDILSGMGIFDDWLPEDWWTTMVPNNPLTDTSRWTVLSSRFANFHELVAPSLADGSLHLSVQRWLPGDPPVSGLNLSGDHAVRVFKTLDKSGWKGFTGTPVDGLLNVIGTTAEDFINELRTELARDVPSEYKLPGIFGTRKDSPFVVIPEGQYTPLTSSTTTIHKAIAYAMVTGGKSPQWVNSLANLVANAALGWLGAAIGNPGLAIGVFSFLIEDTILAFHRVPNPVLKSKMGPDAAWESWVQGPGVGFTLSTLQAIRTGFFDTRQYTSFQAEVDPAALGFVLGKHFNLMDRVAFEIGGELYIDHLTRWGVSWSRDQPVKYRMTIGDGAAEESPAAKMQRYKQSILSLIQQQGVLADGGTV